MIQLLYNLLITLLAPLAIPYWAARSYAKGHSPSSLLEALGWIPALKDTTGPRAVWFHAVSVGEVQSSVALLRALRGELPRAPIYVTTGTATGRKLAEEKLRGLVEGVFRAPIDLPVCVSRVFSVLQPRLLIVAETELWPNYFYQAKRHGAAAMIVNGRISDRSAARYKRFRALFRPALHCLDKILVQSELDRERFVSTGARPSTTVVGGNLKYDFDPGTSIKHLSADLTSFLKRCEPEPLVVAGSTREGEESGLVPALLALAECTPGLLFAVAPRHPHRFDRAARVLAQSGLPVVRRSQIGDVPPPALPAVMVLDSLGELAAMYSRADFVFVGGSLNGWGGHNVLEPVSFGKAVVVGPFMQNFQQVTDDLLASRGLLQVDNAAGLTSTLIRLAVSPEERDSIGAAGKCLADSKRGAADRAAREASALYRNAQPRRPPSALAYLALRIPSAIWSAVAGGRRWVYGRGLLLSKRLSTPVISVGNLSVGGTGKTPTVAWLVEQLAERGHSVAVLSRGYGRSDRATHLISAGELADPRVVGDEPAMLAGRFSATAPRTVIGVGADRFTTGQLVEQRATPDFLILDDGFQHIQLARSLNIVLLDAGRPFSNGHTIPLGRLRESPASLRAADVVVVTRSHPDLEYSTLDRMIRLRNAGVKVFHSRMAVKRLVDLSDGRSYPLKTLVGQRVAAFCGIGNPRSFFFEAQRLGCELVLKRAFRDHHKYTKRDIARLRRDAIQKSADAFMTTDKDAMNLCDPDRLTLRVFVLQIELVVDRAEELLQLVISANASQT